MSYDITSATMDALQEPLRPYDIAPVEYRGSRRCPRCACSWVIDDISAPSPIEDWCKEPLKWHPKGCYCHSPVFAMTYLDEKARLAEEVVGEV